MCFVSSHLDPPCWSNRARSSSKELCLQLVTLQKFLSEHPDTVSIKPSQAAEQTKDSHTLGNQPELSSLPLFPSSGLEPVPWVLFSNFHGIHWCLRCPRLITCRSWPTHGPGTHKTASVSSQGISDFPSPLQSVFLRLLIDCDPPGGYVGSPSQM